jgi:hypothetical protein
MIAHPKKSEEIEGVGVRMGIFSGGDFFEEGS